MNQRRRASWPKRRVTVGVAVAAIVGLLPLSAAAQTIPGPDMTEPDLEDPRYELEAGNIGAGSPYAGSGTVEIDPADLAETVASGLEHLALTDKPVFPPASGAFNYSNINSDLAFQGDYAFSGNYLGFGIYDVSDPAAPELVTTVVCPGGQGDLSVHGDLLFMSVESKRSSTACDSTTMSNGWSGIRIFDISDITEPRYVKAVDTCRGSHTHTVVEDLDDPRNVYVYVSGTAAVRGGTGPWTATCDVGPSGSNPASFLDGDGQPVATDRFQIEIIKVPVSAPELAAVIDKPRVLADPETGNPHGLWPGGNHGEGTQSTRVSDHCHDITAYPELGLAAGACSGNGILMDISDPEAPVRIDAAIDPNFAYWHSATFSNDGTKVVFTDEWGGGTGARCRTTDPANWGANAIFDIVEDEAGNRSLEWRSHYKIPNVQATNETCVAHNGNLIPIPGRDVMVQAWYEGGVSVFDFTDSANPREIAYFDRGPYHPEVFHQGGYWSVYWHNGYIYGNEIFLGFDSWQLTASDELSQGEIDAAAAFRVEDNNAQAQRRFETELAVPNADAGGPYDVVVGEELVLDGSGSSSPDDGELTYSWDLSALGVEEPATDAVVTVVPEEVGEFTISLTVSDERDPAMVAIDEAIVTVTVPPVACAGTGGSFTDVVGGPHAANIGCVADYGVALGTGDGSTFSPDRSVRRDQMASFLHRLLRVADAELPDDAPDAWRDDDGSVHEDAIDDLTAMGIVQGTNRGGFDPSGTVTRDQMASFLVRTVEVIRGTELTAPASPFTDTAGSVHAGNIDVAFDLGIAEGRSATQFAPRRDVRRDQMGSFLARTLEHLAVEGVELTPLD
ncbi:hypothetical protein FTX61_06740 [Nitriliruptoraceae bacterium ZYF776]|nr:hypothetical protein [Profundirhabdus halotolerans]